MRALFISDVYFPRVNGVSTSIATFREDLAGEGVETLLVAPRYEGAGEAGAAAAATAAAENAAAAAGAAAGGPRVLRVSAAHVPGDPEDRRMRWRALRQTLDALSPREIDLVHIHTPFVAHYAGVGFARRAGLPCIATYHTFFEEYLHHYAPLVPHGVGRLVARLFTRSQCAQVQALIAPSEPMRAVLAAYGVTTPIHVLPTGLAADRFRPGAGARFRALAGISPERRLVTYIGRVAHEKNIGFLVRMFAEVRARVPEALLVIAGEGPARENLSAQVAALGLADHVHFAGYLDRNSQLLDCYAAADAFVFASRTETQGLVLLEAMAQGVPVVSTAELGTRSVLLPESGALVVPEETPAFAAAVVRLLTEPALRQALGARGLAYARTWSSVAMARRLKCLYMELVNGSQFSRIAA